MARKSSGSGGRPINWHDVHMLLFSFLAVGFVAIVAGLILWFVHHSPVVRSNTGGEIGTLVLLTAAAVAFGVGAVYHYRKAEQLRQRQAYFAPIKPSLKARLDRLQR